MKRKILMILGILILTGCMFRMTPSERVEEFFNDYIKADDHFRKALSIFEKALGNDHPTTEKKKKIVELLETLELVLKQ